MRDDFSKFATGAVIDHLVREQALVSFGAAGSDVATTQFDGAFEALRAKGICYFNLRDYERDFLKSEGDAAIKSRRIIMPSGVLEPIHQRTGICTGAAFAEAAYLSWCYRFVATGTGGVPKEVSFAATYLLARGGLRGDGGSYPPLAALAYHDRGCLPVDAPGKYDLRSFTTSKQEDVAIYLRDGVVFQQSWVDAMLTNRCRVYSPTSAASLLDAISSGAASTVGMSVQGNRPPLRSNGISSLESLNGAHETAISGWGVLGGRTFITRVESWGDFPAELWPGKRVVAQTDTGPVKLGEAESAVWLDEMMRYQPELWSVAAPGSIS